MSTTKTKKYEEIFLDYGADCIRDYKNGHAAEDIIKDMAKVVMDVARDHDKAMDRARYMYRKAIAGHELNSELRDILRAHEIPFDEAVNRYLRETAPGMAEHETL